MRYFLHSKYVLISILLFGACGTQKSSENSEKSYFQYIPKLLNAKRLMWEFKGEEDSLRDVGPLGYQFVDRKSGNTIFPDTFEIATLFNSHGYCLVVKNGVRYLMDNKGSKTNLPLAGYDFIGSNKHLLIGKTIVNNDDSKKNLMGIIDYNLQSIIPIKYYDIKLRNIGGVEFYLASNNDPYETTEDLYDLYDQYGNLLLENIKDLDDETNSMRKIDLDPSRFNDSQQKVFKLFKSPRVKIEFQSGERCLFALLSEGNRTKVLNLNQPTTREIETEYLFQVIEENEFKKVFNILGEKILTFSDSFVTNPSQGIYKKPDELELLKGSSLFDLNNCGYIISYDLDIEDGPDNEMYIINGKGDLVLHQKYSDYSMVKDEYREFVIIDDSIAFSLGKGTVKLPKGNKDYFYTNSNAGGELFRLLYIENNNFIDLGESRIIVSNFYYDNIDFNNLFLFGRSCFHIQRNLNNWQILPIQQPEDSKFISSVRYFEPEKVVIMYVKKDSQDNSNILARIYDDSNNYYLPGLYREVYYVNQEIIIAENKQMQLIFWDRDKKQIVHSVDLPEDPYEITIGARSIYLPNDTQGVFLDFLGNTLAEIDLTKDSEVDIIAEFSRGYVVMLAEFKEESVILWDRDTLTVKKVNSKMSANSGILYSTNGMNCFYKCGINPPLEIGTSGFENFEFINLPSGFENYIKLDIILDKKRNRFFIVCKDKVLSEGEYLKGNIHFQSSKEYSENNGLIAQEYFIFSTGLNKTFILKDSEIYDSVNFDVHEIYDINYYFAYDPNQCISKNKALLSQIFVLVRVDRNNPSKSVLRFYDIDTKSFLKINDSLFVNNLLFSASWDIEGYQNQTFNCDIIAGGVLDNGQKLFKHLDTSHAMKQYFSDAIITGDNIYYKVKSKDFLQIYNYEGVMIKQFETKNENEIDIEYDGDGYLTWYNYGSASSDGNSPAQCKSGIITEYGKVVESCINYQITDKETSNFYKYEFGNSFLIENVYWNMKNIDEHGVYSIDPYGTGNFIWINAEDGTVFWDLK